MAEHDRLTTPPPKNPLAQVDTSQPCTITVWGFVRFNILSNKDENTCLTKTQSPSAPEKQSIPV